MPFTTLNNASLSSLNSQFLHFLRAVSAQLVCIGHLLVHFELSDSQVIAYLPSFAVLIFFVLSGYLIAFTTDKKSRAYGFRNYMADRFGRIYSVLLPVLAFTGLLMWLYAEPYLLDIKPITGSFLSALFLLYDHPFFTYHVADPLLGTDLTAYFFAGNLPLWSLCVEWWMYVLYGLIFFMRPKEFRLIHVIPAFIGISYAGAFLFLEGRAGHAVSAIWLAGAGIYYFSRNLNAHSMIQYLPVPTLILTILCLFFARDFAVIAFILFFYSSVTTFQQGSSAFLSAVFKSLKWNAAYSYSLYLLHYPIMLYTDTFELSSIMKFVVAFLLSNVLAYAFYLIFERHHRKLSAGVKRLLAGEFTFRTS